MICPACSSNNPDDSRFCAKCGAALKEHAPRVCPRCGVANDPIFQFCRACSTDLDEPRERYVLDPAAQKPAPTAYSPYTTPFQSADSVYSVKSTPFSPDPEPQFPQSGDGSPPNEFAPPQTPMPFSPGAEPFYPPQPGPPSYAPGQPYAQQSYPANHTFDQTQAAPYVGDEQPLVTTKRARRRLKWLLRALLALLALTLLASGVFAYMDRVAHSEKLPTITDMGLENNK